MPLIAKDISVNMSQTDTPQTSPALLFGESDAMRYTNHTALVDCMNQIRPGVNAYDPIGNPSAIDRTGFDYWVNQQSTTVPEITVIGGFIASQEYHDRFLP